jgi:predicted ArsR family transcriptional regulator
VDRQAVAAVAALDDDVRRALYEYVCAAPAPVTREQAAGTVGISRKLAAFHLDKLVDCELLRSEFRATQVRRVGRAPRLYRPAGRDVVVRLPQRLPELLAAVLVEALAVDDGVSGAVRVAREHGRQLGVRERAAGRPGRVGPERAGALVREVLSRSGFAPVVEGEVTRLRVCPFHPLAAQAPELVCGVNHAFLCGLLAGLEVDRALEADLVPHSAACCVELRPAARRIAPGGAPSG